LFASVIEARVPWVQLDRADLDKVLSNDWGGVGPSFCVYGRTLDG
jgi:hypothetical protein